MANLTSLRYNIAIQFHSENQTVFEDVQYMAVIRTPFLKQSNVYLLKINLDPIVTQQLRNDINDLKDPLLRLMIYGIGEDMDKPAVSLYDRDMVIIDMNVDGDENVLNQPSVCVRLTLVNPVIYEMSNRFSYNKVLTSITPQNVLLDYESYITQTYGDIFLSKHLFTSPNTFMYDQIITTPTEEQVELSDGSSFTYYCDSDLNIPTYINYKYKIDDVMGFYYFDDFDLTNKEKLITRHFVSLYDITKMEKIKIEEYGDIIRRGAKIKNIPFNDNTQVLIAKTSVYNYRTPDNRYATEKVYTGENLQLKQTSTSEISINSEKQRTTTSVRAAIQKSQANISVKNIKVYAPDSIEQAKNRVHRMTEVFNERIDDMEEFTFDETSPDWLQFGKAYNLAINTLQNFNYTPISIVNVFNRINFNEVYLSHHYKTCVIKFKK